VAQPGGLTLGFALHLVYFTAREVLFRFCFVFDLVTFTFDSSMPETMSGAVE